MSEFDTLKDLKADIKKEDDRRAHRRLPSAPFEDVLMAKVAESVEAEIPTEMVELQAAQMTEGFKQQLASQGIPFDQYLKMTNTTEADFEAGLRPCRAAGEDGSGRQGDHRCREVGCHRRRGGGRDEERGRQIRHGSGYREEVSAPQRK